MKTIGGPLALLWNLRLAKEVRQSLHAGIDRLAAVCVADVRAEVAAN
jgi:hypothetical protein